MPSKTYTLPTPLLDSREINSIDGLTYKYIQLKKPSAVTKLARKTLDVAPVEIKFLGVDIKKAFSEKDLYNQCMNVVVDGFKVLEEKTAKHTISRNSIISQVDRIIPDITVTDLNEFCLARSYDLMKLITLQKYQNLAFVFVEGSITGVLGFAGVPFNLVLSTFLFFRAVQSIAMFYGYDVKNDENELVIASEVFMKSLFSENDKDDELSDIFEKIMMMNKATAFYKNTSGNSDFKIKETTQIILDRMYDLAGQSAKRAVEKVGQKTFEETVFKELFEQIGKKLTKGFQKKSIPIVSLATGAFFDTVQMKKLIDYANIFYCKRFILEKEKRINSITE